MIATLLAPAVALLLSAPPALLLNAPPAPLLIAPPAPLLNAPPAPTQKLRPNKKSIAATSAFLDQSEFFGFSGVVLIAVGDKVLLHEGYGFADAGAGIPNGPETVFEIASITKPITAAAVLSLVEDELIDLDDSIADLLPGVDREYADIQVEHLLAHTSGVGAGNDGGRGEDLAQAVSGYLGTRSQRKAGKVFDYWNGGYALLAGIVESKVEGSYVDYCRSRLFERAGLESTGFTGDEERWEPERQAVGYAGGVPVRLASGHAYDDVYDYRYRGMGGVVTTAEELWRLTRAITEGDLLEDRLQRKMLDPGKGQYGLGWFVDRTRRKTLRYSHNGDVRGFHSALRIFPESDTTIVVLANVGEIRIASFVENVEALAFGARPENAVAPDVYETKASSYGKLAGRYEGSGYALDVEAVEGGVELHPLDCRTLFLLHPGGPPAESAQSALESAKRVVEGIANGDEKPLGRLVGPGIPEAWPSNVVSELYPARSKDLGARTGVEPRAASMGLEGVAECAWAIVHEKGEVTVKVTFDAGSVTKLELDAPGASAKRRFACITKRRKGRETRAFIGHSWTFGNPLRLRFDPSSGKVRRLVLHRENEADVVLERAD